MMQRGRRIAFDYGDVRIGVAVSDPDSILASPHCTLLTSDKNLYASIKSLVDEYEPVQIFVGKPTLLSGNSGAAVEKVEQFVAKLIQLTNIEPILIDERMSTISAARNLREAGKSTKDSKDSIDMAAAVSILEFGMELEKRKG